MPERGLHTVWTTRHKGCCFTCLRYRFSAVNNMTYAATRASSVFATVCVSKPSCTQADRYEVGRQTSQCNRLPGQFGGSMHTNTVSFVKALVAARQTMPFMTIKHQSIESRASQCLCASAAMLPSSMVAHGNLCQKRPNSMPGIEGISYHHDWSSWNQKSVESPKTIIWQFSRLGFTLYYGQI